MTFKFTGDWKNPNWAIALGLVLGACGSAPHEPNGRDAQWAATRWPSATLEQLESGRRVFSARCSSCHGLPSPDSKTPDQWANVIDEMAPRAHLSPEDRDAVLRYLSAESQRLRTEG